MRILFIHNNFPGQYRRILERLKDDRNYELRAATLASNKQPMTIPAVGYKLHREPAATTHPPIATSTVSSSAMRPGCSMRSPACPSVPRSRPSCPPPATAPRACSPSAWTPGAWCPTSTG